MSTSSGERRYGGKTASERRSERRERLLDAGLELFGSRGYAATSIELLCAQAGLNARYFYEQFETRERLLGAVYDRHIETLFAAVSTAVGDAPADAFIRLRLGLTTFVEHAFTHPLEARISFVEMVGVSAELERRRREVMGRYAGLIAAQFEQLVPPGTQPPGGDLHMAAVALVAATDGLIIDRLSDAARGAPAAEDRERIVGSLLGIFGVAVRAELPAQHPGLAGAP